MNTYTYRLGEALYINLTNRCTNACDFCVRNQHDGMGEYNLWLEKEPTAQEVIEQLGNIEQYKEIVFCGFGEPTMRLDVMLEVCKFIRQKSQIPIRVNTNGHASLYAGYDTAPKFKGLVDILSISLNAANAQDYQKVCHCEYGEEGFTAMLDFVRKVRPYVKRVILSIVDILPQEEQEKCKQITSELGVELRIRKMIG